jgi:nicotinamidase-related amidase
MSIKKKLIISLLAVIVIIAVFVVFAAKKIYTPTQGVKISKYDNPRKALLVIDVQEDFSGLKGKQPVPLKNVGEQIAVINGLIDNASKSGMEVVYIRQIFDDNFITRNFIGRAIEGQAGVELDGRVRVVNKNDFTKKIADAFSNPELDKFFIGNRVDELYLTGLDAAYCVYYTAMGAKNRGYKFAVVKDAVMTQKKMADVLKQYDKDGISIVTSKDIIVSKNAK